MGAAGLSWKRMTINAKDAFDALVARMLKHTLGSRASAAMLTTQFVALTGQGRMEYMNLERLPPLPREPDSEMCPDATTLTTLSLPRLTTQVALRHPVLQPHLLQKDVAVDLFPLATLKFRTTMDLIGHNGI